VNCEPEDSEAMKTNRPDCSRWREAIRARAAEGVAAEESPRLQGHLALCADCRRYAEELRAAAAGLRWLADRPAEPSPGFRARWTRAVEAAAQPAGVGETAAALVAWLREMLLRNRRPALGVASLWGLALLFRLSAPDIATNPQPMAVVSPVEILRALKTTEQLMAGELGPQLRAPASSRKPERARPRSENPPSKPTAGAPLGTCFTILPQPSRAGATVA